MPGIVDGFGNLRAPLKQPFTFLLIHPCFRRFSGVSEEQIDEVARKYAASVGSLPGSAAGSVTGGSHDGTGFPTIREMSHVADHLAEGGVKARALVERITDLERRLPPHMERLRNGLVTAPHAGAGISAGVAHSNKSAPEGSLLNRVEVLEEALDALLVAQEAALLYQQQLIDAQQTERAQEKLDSSSSGCCCTIS